MINQYDADPGARVKRLVATRALNMAASAHDRWRRRKPR
jgi:hypothetical protein